MSCFPELTYAIYVDGELPAEEARQVGVHLAVCFRCRRLVETLQAESALLAEVLQETDEVPVAVPARTMRPLDILWTALVVAAGAAGLQAVLNWLDELRPPESAGWFDPLSMAVQLNLLIRTVFYFVQEGAVMLTSSLTTIGTLVLGLLVVAGGLFLLRRRPATAAVLVTLTLVLCLALPGWALERRKGTTVTVASDETLDDTLLATGETVTVDGTITGDLITFGKRVAINGTVKGDVISFGQSMDLDGRVEGSVYSFTQRMSVRGEVVRNIYVFADNFQLEPGGRADADLTAFVSQLSVDGSVGRDLVAFSGMTDVRGAVGRHLTARTGRITLLAPARVGGNLTVYCKKKEAVHIDPGATVVGETTTHLRRPRPSPFTRPKFYFWQGVRLAAAFFTGLLLFWLFPALFAARLETAGRVLLTMGVGFLALVALPIAAIIAAITLIGLPIGLLGLVTWLAGLYLAKIFVAAFLGQALMRPPAGQMASFALALLVGLVIVLVAINIPYVGRWIHFLAILLGFGVGAIQAYRGWGRAKIAA